MDHEVQASKTDLLRRGYDVDGWRARLRPLLRLRDLAKYLRRDSMFDEVEGTIKSIEHSTVRFEDAEGEAIVTNPQDWAPGDKMKISSAVWENEEWEAGLLGIVTALFPDGRIKSVLMQQDTPDRQFILSVEIGNLGGGHTSDLMEDPNTFFCNIRLPRNVLWTSPMETALRIWWQLRFEMQSNQIDSVPRRRRPRSPHAMGRAADVMLPGGFDPLHIEFPDG